MSKILATVEYGIHDIEPLAVQFNDYSTVSLVTSPYGDGIAIFKDGAGDDLSATHMTTGSAAVSGNIVTTKPIHGLLGGHYYIVAIVVTVNGTTQQKHFYVRIEVVNEKSGLLRKK